MQAGYRGQAPYVTYLFFRMVMPIVMLVVSLFYIFIVLELDQPPLIKVGMCLGAAYVGMQCRTCSSRTRSSSASCRSSARSRTRSICC